jgi:hypothetical protein
MSANAVVDQLLLRRDQPSESGLLRVAA